MSAEASHPTDALLSLLYGELPGPEAARVQAHVDGCAACARRLEEYRGVRKAAASLPREIASDTGLASLLQYGAQAATRARQRRTTRITASVLAACVGALLLFVAFPRRPTETTLASAPSAPSAVGPLAQNDVEVKAPERGEPKALPEGAAVLRRAPSVAPAAPAEAKASSLRPTDAKKARQKDEAAAAAPGTDALASADKASETARLTPPPAASQRAALATGARGVAGAGALGARNSAAASPSAAASEALKASPLDAGSAQALLDEQRRRTLLQQLQTASGPSALLALSELCTLDAKLGHRDEAQRTCTQLVQGYPGTDEARAAQRTLDALHAP